LIALFSAPSILKIYELLIFVGQ